MDIQNGIQHLIKKLNPKKGTTNLHLYRTSKAFLENHRTLRSHFFHNNLCMKQVEIVYTGLAEKFYIASDATRADSLLQVFSAIANNEFEHPYSVDLRMSLLHFLHLLSPGCKSFVINKKFATEFTDVHALENNDTSYLLNVVASTDDEFYIRSFSTVESESEMDTEDDKSQSENEFQLICTTGNSPLPTNCSIPIFPERITVVETVDMLKNLVAPTDVIDSFEYELCNSILSSFSHLEAFHLPVCTTHLSNKCISSIGCDFLISSVNVIHELYFQVASSAPSSEFISDLGLACGRFLELFKNQLSSLTSSLEPVSLVNICHKTSGIRRLINSLGSSLVQLKDLSTNSTPIECSRLLINCAFRLQTQLNIALLGCDLSSSSWLLYFWIACARTILRACIHKAFLPFSECSPFVWFDDSVCQDACSYIGQIHLYDLYTLLGLTHRYLILLRNCTKEAGESKMQSSLLLLPMSFDACVIEILKSQKNKIEVTKDGALSPILPLGYQYALPIDIVDELSKKWMTSLKMECKNIATQLYSIWSKSGLSSWLLGVRLVFLCQSTIQFSAGNSYAEKQLSRPLEILALHLPKDLWFQHLPPNIRQQMLNKCITSDILHVRDVDNLTKQYLTCRTVSQALEYMDSLNIEDHQPTVLFPISQFLCPDILAKYVRIHSFLIAFHVSKNWLSRALFNNDPQVSCYGKYTLLRVAPCSQRSSTSVVLGPCDRLLWLLRYAIFFALNALQQYFFTSIICAQCNQLEKRLEDCRSADDLEEIHDDFLQAIVTGCLLPVGRRTYQASLRHLFVLSDVISHRKNIQFQDEPNRDAQLTNLSGNHTQISDNPNVTNFKAFEAPSWRSLSNDTFQCIRFLADTLSHSAFGSHTVSKKNTESNSFDSQFSSSSIVWLATELHHTADIVSVQSKALLKCMQGHSRFLS